MHHRCGSPLSGSVIILQYPWGSHLPPSGLWGAPAWVGRGLGGTQPSPQWAGHPIPQAQGHGPSEHAGNSRHEVGRIQGSLLHWDSFKS